MDKRTKRRLQKKSRKAKKKAIEVRVMNDEQRNRMASLMKLWREDPYSAPTPYHRYAMVSAILAAIELERLGKIKSFQMGEEYIADAFKANLPLMKKAYEVNPTSFEDFELLGDE